MALFAYCFLLYCLGGFSASVTYHRILTHRAATLQPLFRKVLLVLALPLGTPMQWVGSHRQHHQCADRPGDPHSPVVDGFWYAHCGWYIQSKNTVLCMAYASLGIFRMYFDAYWRPRSNQEYNGKAADIQQDPFCSLLSQIFVYQWIMWIYASVLLGFSYLCFGMAGIVATWFTIFLVYNLGDSINSFTHSAEASGAAPHRARNNIFLAYAAFGEGWHGRHHDRADQVNLGKQDRKTDLGYRLMQVFAYLGLLKFQTRKIES